MQSEMHRQASSFPFLKDHHPSYTTCKWEAAGLPAKLAWLAGNSSKDVYVCVCEVYVSKEDRERENEPAMNPGGPLYY